MRILLLLLLLPGLASADLYRNRDGQTINSYNEKTVNKSIDVSSESISESSNGDQVSMNSSQFYALSVMFPQAAGCFTGVQGGGTDNAQGGFLGFHLLNKSCWLNQVASTERDIDLNARLLCGDAKYRNAIAYDVPRKDRQAACIRMKAKSGQDQMDTLKAEVERLKANNTAMMGEHAKIIDECEAANDRGDARLARCNERWEEAQHK